MSSKSEQCEKTIAKVDSLTVYEVKEEELDILKEWPNIRHWWLFDFFIFFIWIGSAQLVTLWSWLWPQDSTKSIILCSWSIASCIIGIIILALRFIIKKDNKFEETCKKIVDRHTID